MALDDGDNWLVLYWSQDAHGNAVATSGIIVVSRTEPPVGGFPGISWAHGTVGVADLCEGYGFTPLLLCGALAGDPQIRPEQVDRSRPHRPGRRRSACQGQSSRPAQGH